MSEFDTPYRITRLDGSEETFIPFRVVQVNGDVTPIVLTVEEARGTVVGLAAVLLRATTTTREGGTR